MSNTETDTPRGPISKYVRPAIAFPFFFASSVLTANAIVFGRIACWIGGGEPDDLY